MNIRIAKFFSYLLHPVFLPILLVLVLRFFAPISTFYGLFSLKSFVAFCAILILYTSVFPTVLIYWLLKKNQISSFELSKREDRPKVYFIVSAFYITLCYFFYSKGGLLFTTSKILAAITISIIGLGVISFKSKISAHTSGLAGFIAILLFLYLKYFELSLYLPILFLFVLAGISGSARLRLEAHTLSEVTLGFIWGFVSCFVSLYFLI